jgi:uracil phosphoribosyltransferase
VLKVIGVPTVPVRVVLAIVSGACATAAALKIKLLLAELATKNAPCAAFVAITVHVVAILAVSVVTPLRLESVQLKLAGESLKVIAPVPEPPVVVNVMRVPTGLVVVVFEIVSGAWAPKKVKVTAADVAEPYVASEAFVAVTEQVVAVEAVS